MDITFSLQNGQYIAEFKVTSEFNLHIEKGVGTMQMLQRTSGTFFDKVEDFKMEKGDVVYDFDSGSFIGEKTIRLVSSVEPRYCFITTSGEVTEIKSQSKEVEVTSNGTTEVTPDAGFAYLNSVKVKTNVAQSGEGGGSVSDVYVNFDVPEDVTPGGLIGELIAGIPIIEVAYKNKHHGYSLDQGPTAIIQYFLDPSIFDDVTEVIGFHFSGQIMTPDGLVNVLDYLLSISPLPTKPITKEEFYNLNA